MNSSCSALSTDFLSVPWSNFQYIIYKMSMLDAVTSKYLSIAMLPLMMIYFECAALHLSKKKIKVGM